MGTAQELSIYVVKNFFELFDKELFSCSHKQILKLSNSIENQIWSETHIYLVCVCRIIISVPFFITSFYWIEDDLLSLASWPACAHPTTTYFVFAE